ncbi:Down syndrome cell adhesion molecule-like protein Dscam2, partial [Leptotrombidium deliense]
SPSKATVPQFSANFVPNNAIIVKEGDSILLACSFDGNPTPNVHWHRESIEHISSQQPFSTHSLHKLNPSILYINRVLPKDSGKYICAANNSVGLSRYEIEIRVKPTFKVFLHSSNVDLSVGSETVLNCSLLDVHLTSSDKAFVREVVFYRNTVRVAFDHRIRKIAENAIHIRSFRYSDSGIYQCFVRTWFGVDEEHWQQSSLSLRVSEKAPMFGSVFSEQIKPMNSELSLQCIALGQPVPVIIWKLDGVEIQNSHRHRIHSYTNSDARGTLAQLNISALSQQDSGMYECIASNVAGVVSHKARVHLIGVPAVNPTTNVTAIVGQPFEMYCPYSGYPIDEIVFFKGKK